MNEQRAYSYRPLFGHVFLEVQRFFATLRSSRPREDGEPEPPIVVMGTPQAAFRKIYTPQSNSSENTVSINGQPNLPLINFIAIDFRRVYAQENPYARSTNRQFIENTWGQERTVVNYSAQSWIINFQVSLWTDTYKQRDDLMSKILTAFRHELFIKAFPDPNIVDDFYWIELRMDDTFTDDTNLEDLGEKDSRKLIRTSFLMTCQTALPYDSTEYSIVKSIEVYNTMWRNNGETFRLDAETVNGEMVITLNPNSWIA